MGRGGFRPIPEAARLYLCAFDALTDAVARGDMECARSARNLMRELGFEGAHGMRFARRRRPDAMVERAVELLFRGVEQ